MKTYLTLIALTALTAQAQFDTNWPPAGGTNLLWSGTTSYSLDTATAFGAGPSNHLVLYSTPDLRQPMTAFASNIIGGAVLQLTDTNQNRFYSATVAGPVIWSTNLVGNKLLYSNPGSYGWQPYTNNSATDLGGRVVAAIGRLGDVWTGTGTVSVPMPAYSDAYRFSLDWTGAAPQTNYPVLLRGF